MPKVKHATLIIISGFIWFAIGCFLLTLGLGFIVEGTKQAHSIDAIFSNHPILSSLSPYLGGIEETALVLIAICLFIGHLKGKHVLGKSAKKGVERIRTFPEPTSLSNIYSAKYYILLAVMVGLGMSIKFLGLSNDIRGGIDVIIGAALINGAMIYFRHLWASKKQVPEKCVK